MRQAIEDDFAISVQPAQDGGWLGTLIDAGGKAWPVGLFANPDVAVRSALRARAVAVAGGRVPSFV